MRTGENGIMKKKSVLMQRDIEDQKEEMKNLLVKEKELHDQIKMLEKEVRCSARCRSVVVLGTMISSVVAAL